MTQQEAIKNIRYEMAFPTNNKIYKESQAQGLFCSKVTYLI